MNLFVAVLILWGVFTVVVFPTLTYFKSSWFNFGNYGHRVTSGILAQMALIAIYVLCKVFALALVEVLLWMVYEVSYA